MGKWFFVVLMVAFSCSAFADNAQDRCLATDLIEPGNPPGGISNGGNTCYLASALQLFAQGYHAQLEGDDSVISYLKPALESLTSGQPCLNIGEIAATLFAQGVTDAPLGQTGCALEVMGQLVQRLDQAPLAVRIHVIPFGEEKILRPLEPGEQMPAADELFHLSEEQLLTLPVTNVLGAVGDTLDFCLNSLLNSMVENVRFARDGMVVEAEKGIEEGLLDDDTLPELLPIGLRRQIYVAGLPVKMEQDIHVDSLWTIPKRYLAKQSPEVIYQLIGFVRHWGNSAGGHYTAYILRARDWYCADDSAVTLVEESEAHRQAKQAMILLFKRTRI